MGKLSTEAMLEVVEFRQALAWHLSGNHYPPVPSVMITPCLEAIANANAGEWDKAVTLPDGILWRNEATCPTHALIESLHLDSFLDSDDSDV